MPIRPMPEYAVSASLSSSASSTSNTSRFSAIRDGVTDFGMATRPSSMCQRSTSWAGVLPYFWAIATISGSSSRPFP